MSADQSRAYLCFVTNCYVHGVYTPAFWSMKEGGAPGVCPCLDPPVTAAAAAGGDNDDGDDDDG